MKKKLIDLHTHSSASDGLHSPARLIEIASRTGLSAISITDHDTLDGLYEAEAASAKAGIEFIPGVEIGVLHEGEEVHLLGYYLYNHNLIIQELKLQKKERLNRMTAMVNKMSQMGFKIDIDEVLAESGQAAPGRMHLARLLVKRGYVHNTNQAFSLYLKQGAPVYISRKTLSLIAVMELLSKTAKIIAIAHPREAGENLIKLLVEKGLNAIEVFHPEHSREKMAHYKKIAIDNKLLITGGSDYHGDRGNKSYPVRLAIDYIYLESIQKYLYEKYLDGDSSFLSYN